MRQDAVYLILLPPAGGSSASYMIWRENFSCHVVTLEYPGHGTRMGEPCARNMDSLALDLYQEIMRRLPAGAQVLLFGYSMGGMMALILSHMIEEKKSFHLLGLVAAACLPPWSHNGKVDETVRYLVDENPLTARAKTSPLYQKYVLPLLRNDIEMIEHYQAHLFSCLHIPIWCLYGDNDLLVDLEKLPLWKNETKASVTFIPFSGNHFFVIKEQEQVCKKIQDVILFLKRNGDVHVRN